MRAIVGRVTGAGLAPLLAALAWPAAPLARTAEVTPSTMPRVGTVDERYQSYNVEMLEVTGGRFWRPYGPALEAALRQPSPTGRRRAATRRPA